MSKNYVYFTAAALCLVLLLLVPGCGEASGISASPSNPVSPQPSPTDTTPSLSTNSPVSSPTLSITSSPSATISEAQQITNNTISAMSKVNTFKLNVDINFTEQETDRGGIVNNLDTEQWNGNRTVNLADKTLQMSLNMDNSYRGGAKNQNLLQMYIINDWRYFNTNPISASQPSSWTKNKLTDDIWQQEAQINQQIEILQSAAKINLLGSENINGVDCYILEITPSAQSITDWVISQGQPGGPGFEGSFAPALVGDIFGKTYQGNPFKEWIAKDSNLVMQVDLDPIFMAKPADIAWPDFPMPPDSFQNLTAEFKGQMIFSDYNQPVSIQLPVEALNAEEQ